MSQHDAQAGAGGSGRASGSGGIGATGGSDAGGVSGGGSGGSGVDAGGTGAGVDASLPAVDWTLGGFNQDLPAPSVDCLTADGLVLGCMTVSGEYNGEAFDMVCGDTTISVGSDARHIFGCRTDITGGDFLVELLLDSGLVRTPPSVFEVAMPVAYAFNHVWNRTRLFNSYRNRDFDMFLLVGTHDQEFRATGTSEFIWETPSRQDWRVMGTFAHSLTPKSTCVPDTMGFGCDTIRLRGTFQVFPVGP